jgi:hypothetical protein
VSSQIQLTKEQDGSINQHAHTQKILRAVTGSILRHTCRIQNVHSAFVVGPEPEMALRQLHSCDRI